MGFGHGMRQRYIPLIFYALYMNFMRFVRLLSRCGDQVDAAAGERTFPGGPDRVAAYGADIPFAAKQVCRAVFVENTLTGEQLCQ